MNYVEAWDTDLGNLLTPDMKNKKNTVNGHTSTGAHGQTNANTFFQKLAEGQTDTCQQMETWRQGQTDRRAYANKWKQEYKSRQADGRMQTNGNKETWIDKRRRVDIDWIVKGGKAESEAEGDKSVVKFCWGSKIEKHHLGHVTWPRVISNFKPKLQTS